MVELVHEVGEPVTIVFEDGHKIVGKIVRVTDQEVIVTNVAQRLRRKMLEPSLEGWEVLIRVQPDLVKIREVVGED